MLIMNTDRDKLVKEIFADALEKANAAERAAYLAKACGDDVQLRQQVEALLQAHEKAGGFLEDPAAALPGKTIFLSTPLTEKPGDRIGHYKLLQQIGEGGCGLVYMAEQEQPIRRRVALKVIKLGMDTKQVIARFEAERQALALMDHPNIAKVLDAGATGTGRPYFVMELVKGIPITRYCDEYSLSTQARLGLFAQVCQAIQHAHQKGIIHRDIKPSNILVADNDGVPVPKIIDFGIAKATTDQRLTDKTLFTAFEQFIGTPAYMSPEQAKLSGLDIDTRSDIYSLGVLLYELLTGNAPFEAKRLIEAGLDEIRRIIREEEPPRPSTRLHTLGAEEQTTVAKHRQSDPPKLVHLIRGDLDWIVMKCLEKDRGRRYETANGLADDIVRHLNDEPVVARPPGRAYRLQKMVRRNKLVFVAGAAVTAALLIGLVLSMMFFFKEREARQRAVEAEQKAQAEASKSQQVAKFLKDMLQGVGPSVALGRDTTMLREILDKTAQRLNKDLAGQPEVEADLRTTLGWVYLDLGDYLKAETFHRDALALRRNLRGDNRGEVAESLRGLGLALWIQGKLSEAETAQRESLAIRRTLFGDDNLDTANSLNDLAVVLASQGKSIEAESMVREALSTKRRLLRQPDVSVAYSLNLLGFILADQGRLIEAENVLRETLALRRKLLGTKHPDVAFSLAALGAVLAKEEKLAEAESLLYESVAMERELRHIDQPGSSVARLILAKLLAREGKLDEAAELWGKQAGREPAAILNSIAWPLATHFHATLRDGVTAVLFAERAVTETDRKNARYLETLAAAYAEVRQFTNAVNAQKEAIALLPDGKMKEDGRSRLTLYESNSPYRGGSGFENKPSE
jgi:serine/threonine protein kinase/tetratricopeptide (TPR) repeat protein